MNALGLPHSTRDTIIDDPTLLPSLLSSNATASPALQGVTPAVAEQILDGYTSGFRAVFILNASLAAVSVVVAALMIRHKELVRADEAALKRTAREKAEHEGQESHLEQGLQLSSLRA